MADAELKSGTSLAQPSSRPKLPEAYTEFRHCISPSRVRQITKLRVVE
jgi:hypothetical protein